MFKFLVLIIGLAAIQLSYGSEYQVDKSAKNQVKFISDAPMEDFEGVTDKIDGYFISDGIDKLVGSEFYFEVDLNTVKTGIGLRDRHMREDYLHTDKHRFTNIKGKITEARKISDTEYDITVQAKKFIHGVSKDITIQGKIYKVAEGFKIKAAYTVKLPDYNIEVPKFMFMRISEDIKLELDFIVKKVK